MAAYVIMGRRVSNGWTYEEMNDHGDVTSYPTRMAAEERAKELNAARGDGDLVVMEQNEASDYYQYGCPTKSH